MLLIRQLLFPLLVIVVTCWFLVGVLYGSCLFFVVVSFQLFVVVAVAAAVVAGCCCLMLLLWFVVAVALNGVDVAGCLW